MKVVIFLGLSALATFGSIAFAFEPILSRFRTVSAPVCVDSTVRVPGTCPPGSRLRAVVKGALPTSNYGNIASDAALSFSICTCDLAVAVEVK